MKCSCCGAQVGGGKFCEYCGAKLGSETDELKRQCGESEVKNGVSKNVKRYPIVVFENDDVYFAYEPITGLDTDDFDSLEECLEESKKYLIENYEGEPIPTEQELLSNKYVKKIAGKGIKASIKYIEIERKNSANKKAKRYPVVVFEEDGKYYAYEPAINLDTFECDTLGECLEEAKEYITDNYDDEPIPTEQKLMADDYVQDKIDEGVKASIKYVEF